MRKETVDIIRDLILSMDTTFRAKAIILIDLPSFTYKLTTCDTLYTYVKQVVSIGGNDYTVIEVIPGESITVQGSAVLTEKTFVLDKPFYKHGTIIATNIDTQKKKKAIQILPMIYLREGNGFLVDEVLPRDNPNDRRSNLTLYFLTQNEFGQTEENIRKVGIVPMRSLAYTFQNHLRKTKWVIGELESCSIEDWLRFGFQQATGSTKRIFDYMDMSGCEMKLTASFTKKSACCTN